MVFSSPTFLYLFLPIIFIGNLLFSRKIALSNFFLLIASLLFYAWGEPVYVLLMLFTTFINFLLARGISERPANKKAFLLLTVIWNIGSLVFFKYTDFLLSSMNALLGLTIPLPAIDLPIGISFFTFQAMSYVLDVSRRQANMNKNYLDVLLYISFFPQLIAGPIVKYHDIDLQLHDRSITLANTARGFRRFCFGLAKKILIANTLARAADQVFALPADRLNAPIAWLGAVCYLIQIYFDFSGYSDMAIGMGHCFGFSFKENFHYPYIAQNMQDFWRRWHISLSTWFKEYVYIPLGGNRKGTLRTGINKLIVFFLTGLWHGASWNFALWGLYHGGFLMAESYHIIRPLRWPRPLRHIYTILAVLIGFVLFRADTIGGAGMMIYQMFSGWQFTPESTARLSTLLTPLIACTIGLAVIASTPAFARLGIWLTNRSHWAWHILAYAAAGLLLMLCMLNLSTSAYNPFIYFRF